jgi:predicted membrane protein
MTTASRRFSLGRLVGGVLLITVGALWLAEEFTDLDIPWTAILPAILILLGAALMFGASTGSHGGLVVLGSIVAALVVLSSAIDVLVDVPFTGGVGDQQLTPVTLEDEYRWAIGTMTIDLTEVVNPSGTVEMSVGMGELVIVVPVDATVAVEADAGLGEVVVFGDTDSGVSPEVTLGVPGTADYRIIAKVGLGSVEVRRG